MDIVILILVAVCVVGVWVAKLVGEQKKTKSLSVKVKALDMFMEDVKTNPFMLDKERTNETAVFFQMLSETGKSSTKVYPVQIDDEIVCRFEMQLNADREMISKAILEPDLKENRSAIDNVLVSIFGNHTDAGVVTHLLGYDFCRDFISSLIPLFGSDYTYAYVKDIPIPCGTEMEKYHSVADNEEKFSPVNWLSKNKSWLISLGLCILIGATSILLLQCSDTFLVSGVAHMRDFCELYGIPTEIRINYLAVIIGVLGVLLLGVSICCFVTAFNNSLFHNERISYTAKRVLRRYLPFITAFMVLTSVKISVPLTSSEDYWAVVWGENLKQITLWVEVGKKALFALIVLWFLAFCIGDLCRSRGLLILSLTVAYALLMMSIGTTIEIIIFMNCRRKKNSETRHGDTQTIFVSNL